MPWLGTVFVLILFFLSDEKLEYYHSVVSGRLVTFPEETGKLRSSSTSLTSSSPGHLLLPSSPHFGSLDGILFSGRTVE